jgi:FAD/FMN-containing dehydrogenase
MAAIQVEQLRAGVRGAIIQPGDAEYDAARKVYNGMIDKRPAVIVRCVDVADVIAAVNYARASGVRTAIRGGGHNGGGLGTCDDGLVIDLSPMKGIRVEPDTQRVVAQAGVTWRELDHETQAFGLAVTGGLVSSTGVAGFTLGGGIGWLMRKHGLAADNLVAADLVTADGRLVHASEHENAELYWGLRGGAGTSGS